MPTFDEIATFICDEAGVRRSHVTEATSLQDDIGLYGDDIDHLMLEYSKRFDVNLDGYIWYFHTGEEGFSPGALLFRPPDMRVKRISITIGMLYEFAQLGRWNVQCPEHSIPRWRTDILVNWIVVLGFLIFIIAAAIRGRE
jgi:hypothetical protein